MNGEYEGMAANSPHVLVVDDDASIRDALADYLTLHGHRVSTAPDAGAMDAVLAVDAVDVLVLDLMLPGEDGLSICRRLGSAEFPIIVLSALGGAMDRVVGLETGASDYLAKPFEPRELLARVRALRRRRLTNVPARSRVAEFQGWSVDFEEHRLFDPNGALVPLPRAQFSLLAAFVERPGRLLSRGYLMDVTKGTTSDTFDRVIDLTVSRLRRTLDRNERASFIETVRGEGYRFNTMVNFR